MKNTIKQITSGLVLAGVLGSLAINVNAAALNVDSVVYDDGADTITVTDAGTDFTGDLITTLRVTDSSAATVAGVDVADVTEANGSFTVLDAVNLNGLATGIYAVSFVTAGGDFGSATFSVGNADQIQVTANVLPILSMNITGGAVAFGDLVADTPATAGTQTTIAVNTNAANGYTIQVANLGLLDGANQIPDAGANENLTTGYGFGVNASVDAGATIDLKTSAAATIAAAYVGADNTNVSGMSTTPATIASATGPVATQTTTVTYHTRVSALQETGNYTDTITYSITGSF